MPPIVATSVFLVGICGLFLLDRDRTIETSKALCIPFVCLWIASSRSLTEWIAIVQTGRLLPQGDQAEMYANGTPLDRGVLSLLMVLALITIVKRRRLWAIVRTNVPIILFFLYCGFSTFWSDFPDITIRRWFRAVGYLLMTMVVLTERDRDAATKRLLVWVGFILIPLSVLFIKYYPTIGRVYIIENISSWVLSPVGVTEQKNILGLICQVYGLTFVWHLIAAYRDRDRPKRRWHLIAHLSALAMVVWLFGQANSVTAQSAFLLGAIIVIASNFKYVARKRWAIHVLTGVLVGVPFAVLFLGIGQSAIGALGRNSTLTGRTDIWALVVKLVENPLIGSGFESFWLGTRLETMQRHMKGLNEAHNGLLEIYISLGWIGVSLLVLMIAAGYRNIVRRFRQNPAEGGFRLAFLVTVVVSSFTEASFRTLGLGWCMFILVTMADSAGLIRNKVRQSASPDLPQHENSPVVTSLA